MLSIGALAASASRHVVVRVRRDWEEPLNAYVGVGLPSGSRKSPVFGPIMAPLETLERELVKAARRGGQDQDDGRMPQLIAEDITPEAVASLLAEQGGRLALLSDEGGPLELISRYRETPNLEVYLKGHTGTRPLRVNRKGRPPEFVERPSLTIALAVQPDVLRALGDHPTSRARGLTARFLYSLPADNVGYREVDPPEIPEAIASTYQENMLTLARSLAALADAGGQPLALELTDEAAKVLLALMRDLEHRMNPESGDLAHPSHVREWTAKLAGATVRIAGLLHLAEHVRDGWGLPIEAATMRAAVRIGEYLIPHALAVFDLMNADQAVGDARYVLAWLERAEITRFKRRDVLAALRRFAKVSDLDGPVELLEAHGYIRVDGPEEWPKGPGRRPAPSYAVNPLWRQQISGISKTTGGLPDGRPAHPAMGRRGGIVSRGHGWVERAVLTTLSETRSRSGLLTGELVYAVFQDNRITRAQTESVRRAVRTLQREGLIQRSTTTTTTNRLSVVRSALSPRGTKR
jgi:replicative DNA helicase